MENEDDKLAPVDMEDLAPIKDEKLPPSVMVSSLAMNFALKWHNMCLIPDGTYYQAKKAEGANIRQIDLRDVLETAQHFEAWLMASEGRQIEYIKQGVMDQFTNVLLEVTSLAFDKMTDEGEGAPPEEDEGGAIEA